MTNQNDSKRYTVRDLIEVLETVEDKDAIFVVLEGCDCFGDWNGNVDIGGDPKEITLNRD